MLAIAVILLILQWIVLRWALQPLKIVSKELRAIENGEKNQLAEFYPQELTQLTSSINQLIKSEQNQRQRYKDRMADLAHSLKTPLAILNALPIENNQGQSIELKKQVERMTHIVEYQLQRAVLGNQPLSFKKIAIAKIIKQVQQALDKVYQEKNVKCELELDQQLNFRGDEGDLTEIIANLMDNAYKYGAGQVRVSLTREANLIQLRVEDNGAGISQEMFSEVLNRGTRLDSQQQGQGIGMAVVHELITQYHGKIFVSESSLLGACITVELP